MEVAGLCAICGAPGVMHSCAVCGRAVCAVHFSHGAGVCAVHARGGTAPGPPPHGRT